MIQGTLFFPINNLIELNDAPHGLRSTADDANANSGIAPL